MGFAGGLLRYVRAGRVLGLKALVRLLDWTEAFATTIDEFAWHVSNVEGVQSAITLPGIFKILNAGWNEGNPRWRVLPRSQATLAQYVTSIDTSTGLRNESCDAMPILIFTEDHKAATIERIVAAAKDFEAGH